MSHSYSGSRPYTAEEVREQFLQHLHTNAAYWAKLGRTPQEIADGVTFSILVALDGHADLPAFDMLASPHPTDQDFHEKEGTNYYERGTSLHDGEGILLHTLYYQAPTSPHYAAVQQRMKEHDRNL